MLSAEAEVTGILTQFTTPASDSKLVAPISALTMLVRPEDGSTVNALEPTSNPPAIVVVLVKLEMFNPPFEIRTFPLIERFGVVVA